MISLTAPTADLSGALVFKEGSGTRLDIPSARVSRSKTLDGGVHIEHSGVSDGDRTFVVVTPNVTEEQYAILKRLHRTYTSITVACREGVFRGTIDRVRLSQGNAQTTILVKEKLSADG